MDVENVNAHFITNPQFLKQYEHFELVGERLKAELQQADFYEEFTRLLEYLRFYYEENERKKRKLFELNAMKLNVQQLRKSEQKEYEETFQKLKETINQLKTELNYQKIRLKDSNKEIRDLKEIIKKQTNEIERMSLEYNMQETTLVRGIQERQLEQDSTENRNLFERNLGELKGDVEDGKSLSSTSEESLRFNDQESSQQVKAPKHMRKSIKTKKSLETTQLLKYSTQDNKTPYHDVENKSSLESHDVKLLDHSSHERESKKPKTAKKKSVDHNMESDDLRAEKDKCTKKDHYKISKVDHTEIDEFLISEEKLQRYKDDNATLNRTIKLLLLELQISRKKEEELARNLKQKDDIINDYRQESSKKDTRHQQMQEELLNEMKAKKAMIENITDELQNIKHERDNLKKDLRNTLEEKNMFSLETEMASRSIENMEDTIKSLTKEKNATSRRAEMFEEHLAQDQTRMFMAKQEIQNLKKELEEVQDEMLNLMKSTEGVRSEKDSAKKTEMQNLENLVDHCKCQIELKDKRMKVVQEDLFNKTRELRKLKKDICKKDRERMSAVGEVARLKKVIEEQSLALKTLKIQHKAADQEIDQLQKEFKTVKLKYQHAYGERHRYQALYRQLCIVNKQQLTENSLIGKQNEYLVKCLRVEKVQILKSMKFARY